MDAGAERHFLSSCGPAGRGTRPTQRRKELTGGRGQFPFRRRCLASYRGCASNGALHMTRYLLALALASLALPAAAQRVAVNPTLPAYGQPVTVEIRDVSF